MSSLAHLFESGERARQMGHFRNLILIARTDGKISLAESDLLKRFATKLSLTNEQVAEILNNPSDYPSTPPASREERYERFIQLIQMLGADSTINSNEISLVKKLGVELGFTPERIEEKFPVILEHLRKGMNREEVLRSVI